MSLRLRAEDQQGLERIELFLGSSSTPFAEITTGGPFGNPTELSRSVDLPLTGSTTNLYSIRAVVHDTTGNTSEASIEVSTTTDTVDLLADGLGVNDWLALETEVVVLRDGTLTLNEAKRFAGLIVLAGATISHDPWSGGFEPKVELDVDGQVYVECGGGINVQGRGFPVGGFAGVTLPSSGSSGGSHIGQGGHRIGTDGDTYGSVYWPTEAGGTGSFGGARGGGSVRLSAVDLQLDGGLTADGDSGSFEPGGAGGSIILDLDGDLTGAGIVSAIGGGATGFEALRTDLRAQRHQGLAGLGALEFAAFEADPASGGGGAISVLHGGSNEDLSVALHVKGGGQSFQHPGAAGSILLFDSLSRYGNLRVDNAGSNTSRETRLPALGSGLVVDFDGTWLDLDRAEEIPAFFGQHFVRISSALAERGTWRITAIDGRRIRLEATPGELGAVQVGDMWQGVYLFDDIEIVDGAPLESDDLIEAGGTHFITGTLRARSIRAERLVIRSGAVLTRAFPGANQPEPLVIEVSGELLIEPGGSIDVSGLGFAAGETYSGVELPTTNEAGGSHLGEGGLVEGGPGETYGSVARPMEPGAGPRIEGSRGGGVLRLRAGSLRLIDSTSVIRADGGDSPSQNQPAGAGGSIWISVDGTIGGAGSIEAGGGSVVGSTRGSGGGGAVSVEYGSTFGSVLSNVTAASGDGTVSGAPGTVLLRRWDQDFGDLLVANGSTVSDRRTELPALGSGTAVVGSDGSLLETGELELQGFFEGHWVEVETPTGELKGRWRIRSILDGSLELEDPFGGAVGVEPGDSWKGIYRFDSLQMGDQVGVGSRDPILLSSSGEIRGTAVIRSLKTEGDLVVRSGAVVRHPMPVNGVSESLKIEVGGALIIESDASIDVSGLGYEMGQGYPGVSLPTTNESGGSHLGEGGLPVGLAAETYGSIARPREAGGTVTLDGGRGGGIVRIEAVSLNLAGATSSIRANGTSGDLSDQPAGAGGSIWISVRDGVQGDGMIEAVGGAVTTTTRGAGGGGAIAIEYGSTLGSVLSNATANGGSGGRNGAAGTILLRRSDQLFGDLFVDNAGVNSFRSTILPSLGSGIAQVGSDGTTLVVSPQALHAFFVGRWVEILDGGGVLQGTYAVVAVNEAESTIELDPFSGAAVQPGDTWQGVYHFDSLTTTPEVDLLSVDPIRTGTTLSTTGADR